MQVRRRAAFRMGCGMVLPLTVSTSVDRVAGYRHSPGSQRGTASYSCDHIDHSAEIAALIRTIGLDFRVGNSMVRVFGYSPRSDELFDVVAN